MKKLISVLSLLVLGHGIANADDSEIYFSSVTKDASLQPNIIFVLDNSGSMEEVSMDEEIEYDSNTIYADLSGDREVIDPDKVYLYYRTRYQTYQYVGVSLNASQFSTDNDCRQVVLDTISTKETSPYMFGFTSLADETDLTKNQQFEGVAYKPFFTRYDTLEYPVFYTDKNNIQTMYCSRISVEDGVVVSDYTNGSDYRIPDGHFELGVVFFSANQHIFEQYHHFSRLDRLKNVMNGLIDKYNNLNFSILQFNKLNDNIPLSTFSNSRTAHEFGGYVLAHKKSMSKSDEKRAFRATVNSMFANRATPLGSALYETLLYLRGEKPLLGLDSNVFYDNLASVPESMVKTSSNVDGVTTTSTRYKSPIDHICHKTNYIIFLTDGEPTQDFALENDFYSQFLPNMDPNDVPFSVIDAGLVQEGNAGASIAKIREIATKVASADPDDSDVSDICEAYTNTDDPVSGDDHIRSCIQEVAFLLANTDLQKDVNLTKGAAGSNNKQTAKLFTIGFNTNDKTGLLLKTAAEAGNGTNFEVEDYQGLFDAFELILKDAVGANNNFNPPALSTKTMNSLSNADYAFLSLFEPSLNVQWKSNIKRVSLVGKDNEGKEVSGSLYSCEGKDLLDSDGNFVDDESTYWAKANDSSSITKGGFLGQLANVFGSTVTGGTTTKSPTATRNIFTAATGSSGVILGDNHKLNSTNNGVVTAAKLNAEDDEQKTEIINWYLYGQNVTTSTEDEDSNTVSTTTKSFYIGDMMHSSPVNITYKPPSKKLNTGDNICIKGKYNINEVIVAGTNNGFIHAINAQSGKELFSYIPESLLGNLKQYKNNSVSSLNRNYGMDGEPVLWIKKGTNSNENIINQNDGDKVYYYQGMRRGGDEIIALDLTSYTADDANGVTAINPVVAWQMDGASDTFSKLAQTWSTPRLAKVKWACSSTSSTGKTTVSACNKVVLFIGGGYDSDQDNLPLKTSGAYKLDKSDNADDDGNVIYMVDAETGEKLWSASNSGANLNFSTMKNSFPAPVTVVDLNRDGFSDALFAIDVVGRVWRFDFNPAPSKIDRSDFAVGGQVADLSFNNGTNNFARFFNAIDVAKIRNGLLTISVGSGMRFSPNNQDIVDRTYVVYDKNSENFNFSIYNSLQDANSRQKLLEKFYKAVKTAGVANTVYNIVKPTNLNKVENFGTGKIDVIKTYNYGWYRNLEFIKSGLAGFAKSSENTGEKILSSTLTFNNCIYVASYNPSLGDDCKATSGFQRQYSYRAEDGQTCLFTRVGTGENSLLRFPFIDSGQGGIPSAPWLKFSNKDGVQNISVYINQNEVDKTIRGGERDEACRGGAKCMTDQVMKEFWRENP